MGKFIHRKNISTKHRNDCPKNKPEVGPEGAAGEVIQIDTKLGRQYTGPINRFPALPGEHLLFVTIDERDSAVIAMKHVNQT
jgi:hypothetical protein